MLRLGFVIIILSFFISCSGKNNAAVVPVTRDTTILPHMAYTSLNLDSLEVENYLLSDAKDKDITMRIRNFYNHRNYQYAWFDEEGLTEQGEAFWNLHQMQIEESDTSLSARRLHQNMELLLNEDSIILIARDKLETELDLTLHFFRYLNSILQSRVSPEQMQWNIPRMKMSREAMLDSFLTNKNGDWKPLNNSFYRLQDQLVKLTSIVKAGGWPQVQMKKGNFKPGSSGIEISSVKERLIASGDYSFSDTSEIYNPELEPVIKKLQRAYGLKESGIINMELVNRLNIPAMSRLKQIQINLERMKWMPLVGDGVYVNIPEYRLHVFEKGSEVLAMNIIVGKAANRTVIFTDRIENIVFGPYWNVPSSIVRKEILPAIRRSSSYLSRNNMEITGYTNGLPVIRQRPGGDNALGKIKFVFPNRYNIYLHDTPAKTLFENDKRAFSHGCIRIQDPFALAKYLLRNEAQWTDEKIRAAMDNSANRWLKLPNPVKVYIVYFTAWVDSEALLNFRDDIYGHDKRMAGHFFQE